MAKPTSTGSVCHSQIADCEALDYKADVGLTLRIRELRQKRGLTLAQLSGQVGISIPHLSQVERGVKNVNNHLLERIARALGVEPYQLISPDEASRSNLFEIYEHLSEEDQRRLEVFARNLILSKEPPRD